MALLLGILSYGVFLLGLLGLLYTSFTTLIGLAGLTGIILLLLHSKPVLHIQEKLLFSVFVLMVGVNVVGVLGPEYAFDSLWYHLMLPKLYLQNHAIEFIPGGLLYYSAMPKLAEMLYVIGLSFGTEMYAKLIHFSFGLLSLLALYKLARLYLAQKYSLLAAIIFASNIVFAWEMTTAYIDLVRTFYEILALYFFCKWWKEKSRRLLIFSAVMMGFGITTKLLATGSLSVFLVLILYNLTVSKHNYKQILSSFIIYAFIALVIPLPWFGFAFINTGNPYYPFFSSIYPVITSENIFSIKTFAVESVRLFTQTADPISPIYVIMIPLLFVSFKQLKKNALPLLLYSGLVFLVWYFTPRTGGGRFILPYLPAWSLLCALILFHISKQKQQFMYQFTKGVVLMVALITVFYRGAANIRAIPVLLGAESKTAYLTRHLNFDYGDFYDIDGYFINNITSSDSVLLYGFHNLYYVDFPFIHESWVKKGDRFTHIALQGAGELPKRFQGLQMIYKNDKTNVRVYSSREVMYY